MINNLNNGSGLLTPPIQDNHGISDTEDETYYTYNASKTEEMDGGGNNLTDISPMSASKSTTLPYQYKDQYGDVSKEEFRLQQLEMQFEMQKQENR
eukprot:UN06769